MRRLAHFLFVVNKVRINNKAVKRDFHKIEFSEEKLLTTLWITVLMCTK